MGLRTCLFLLVLCALLPRTSAAGPQDPTLPLADLRAAFGEQTRRELWPGFAPRELPYLVFDGEDTFLVGHPDPPGDFHPLEGTPDALRFRGLHPVVRANTSVQFAGTRTGTLLLKPGSDPANAAAVLVHELFHVHQRTAFPGWSADELAVVFYPTADARLLGLRRRESQALRLALEADDLDESAEWARLALDLRKGRHGELTPELSTYEETSELNEGLAQYLQYLARDLPGRRHGFPEGDFGAEALRNRVYASGEAWALLLDLHRPGWTEELTADPSATLTSLLAEPLEPVPAAELDGESVAAITSRAQRDADAVERARQALARRFEDTGTGWSVVVRARAAPLAAQGFDPLNLAPVDRRRLVHRRWVKLGNGRGALECLDTPSMTVSAGDHPLFQGVAEVRVVGLAEEPRVTEAEGRLSLEAEGLTLEFEGARLRRRDTLLEIEL